MSTTVYAVIGTRYEYDDNNYSPNGTEIVQLHRTRESAEREMNRRDVIDLREGDALSYRLDDLMYSSPLIKTEFAETTFLCPVVGVSGEIGLTPEEWGLESVKGGFTIDSHNKFAEMLRKWVQFAPDESILEVIEQLDLGTHSVQSVELMD